MTPSATVARHAHPRLGLDPGPEHGTPRTITDPSTPVGQDRRLTPEPLRICLIASSRFPISEPFAGGLEAQTHALATELRRRGHVVSLFAGPGSDPTLGATILPVAQFTASAAARADVAAPTEVWMAEHHAYLDLMLRLARSESFDLVHNNSLHHLPVAMAGTLEVPMVTTLHTPPLPWLESAAAIAADGGTQTHFVTVSEAMSRAWEHAVPSTVVLNGVDTHTWKAGPGGTRALWSGRLVPEKAPHEAIAAARLAGVPIDLAGPLLDRGYFDEQIRPWLGHGARYLGHLRQRSLRHVAAQARVVLVTPAWDEPFGLVAAEALSTGTPVAAYARGALPEIVTPDLGALAAPGDVAGLAEALLVASRCDRVRVRSEAVRRFSLEAMVDRYEEVYARVREKDLAA